MPKNDISAAKITVMGSIAVAIVTAVGTFFGGFYAAKANAKKDVSPPQINISVVPPKRQHQERAFPFA